MCEYNCPICDLYHCSDGAIKGDEDIDDDDE